MKKEVRRYQLVPDDSHKSFYRKAWAIVYDDGSIALKSYDTIVLVRDADGTLHRKWWGYSATTQRHIKAFCGMNKAEFIALPCEA